MKFTTQGTITVKVNNLDEEGYLEFSVTDTGIGISDQDKKSLFALFGKLKTSKHENTNGIGLGLNICKQICEAFDGDIRVHSVLGQGSIFTFRIKTSTRKQRSLLVY